MHRFFIKLLLILVLFAQEKAAAANLLRTIISVQDSSQAKINLVKEEGKIKIQGVYLGSNTDPISYKLNVQKKGNGGTSSNTQSGKFKKDVSQKEVILSTTSFNVQPGDEFQITLEIYKGLKLLSQEILVYTAP